jgi:hypothetical protein
MNQKISKGMFVKIHPEFREKKIPNALSDNINYEFIDRVKNSLLKVIDIRYKRVYDSHFYELLVNGNSQEIIQFRTKFNIDSTLTYQNGYKCILMAQLETKNRSKFQFPICFLIESLDVPLSIY